MPAKAEALLLQAFAQAGLDPKIEAGQIVGHSKAKLRSNRWSADASATIRGRDSGSLVTVQVSMPAGTKHFAVIDEIANGLDDSVIDDQGLGAVLERLGKASRLFGHLEVRSIRYHLTGTETVYGLGQGILDGHSGMVVLTDERLFFFDKGLISSSDEEFPLKVITTLSVKRRMTGESLLVTTSGNLTEIKQMMHGQGDALVGTFRELKSRSESRSSAPAASVFSAADELAKFAALHEQGVLTDEEFTAKKAEILGL